MQGNTGSGRAGAAASSPRRYGTLLQRFTALPPTPVRLPDELRELLSAQGLQRVVPKGTIVVADGEPAPSMYLVQEGRLRVYVSDEDSREVWPNQLGPDALLRRADARQQRAHCHGAGAGALSANDAGGAGLEQVRRERGDLALYFIQNLVRRVQGLSSMDVYGRMVAPTSSCPSSVGSAMPC